MRSDARAYLPADLFGDPAFDMLLDLFIAREENYQLSITSVVTAGHTPATTGLRWLAKIEKYGLVVRESDPFDARRSYIILNESGHSMIKEWLSRHVSVPEEER
jgi:DNA-binding PadR family transcriptional regulator